MSENKIYNANSLDKLDELDKNSVHAIVTDPPYGLAFMGKSWDDFEPKEYQEWCETWAKKALRVLKPGGHMLAFSGNRTHHRLFSGVEDAGYEIRDTITWHYADGLVGGKSQKIAKSDSNDFRYGLKPATEYIVLARKEFEGNASDNLRQHGVAGLNIGGARIETNGERETGDAGFIRRGRTDEEVFMDSDESGEKGGSYTTTEGRYPSNVVFGEGVSDKRTKSYFYTSKTSKTERTLDGKINNDHPTVKPTDLMEWLVTLVTAENQTVLDPFCGSGTTGIACKNKNREFIGIEQNERYADIARVRCGLTPEDPSVVRSDDNQQGLQAFE